MPNKILKLPDDDGNMYYHRLCPNCHYFTDTYKVKNRK